MKKVNCLNRGFTYIEMLLYIAIIAIILSTLIPFAWSVIGGGAKSDFQQELFSQARYVSERIKYEIRNANGINSINSPVGTIDLSTPTNATTVIDLTGGKVRIKYGAGTPVNLNSNDTTVSSLTFTNYSDNITTGKTKNIQFVFTIDDNYTGQRQEYQVPAVTIEGDAEVRSN